MKRKAIIAGNSAIKKDLILLNDNKALNKALEIKEDADIFIILDNINIKKSELVAEDPKSLIISKKFLKESLMKQLSLEIFGIILESTLRNKANKKSCKLPKNFLKEKDERIVCNCVGLLVIAIEELFKEYDEVILITSLNAKQLKKEDAIKSKVFFEEKERNFKLIFV